MKPKLLLSAGLSTSGSTSLYYTIWNNKYAHGGVVKESNYLYRIQSPKEWEQNKEHNKNKKQFSKDIDKPWKLEDVSNIFNTSLSEKHIHEYLHTKVSLEKYINYNLRLWEEVKDNFQSVADFSNRNSQLTGQFMMSIRDELLKYFDIKVVMIFRDPIRKLWGICNRRSKWGEGSPESILKKYIDYPNVNYVDLYERYVRVWGKHRVKFIINEDFYKGDVQPLSDFLEFPISSSYQDIKYLDDIKGRVYSDWCDIDYETWNYAYNNMKWVYENFENNFGCIPSDWGKWYIASEKPK